MLPQLIAAAFIGWLLSEDEPKKKPAEKSEKKPPAEDKPEKKPKKEDEE